MSSVIKDILEAFHHGLTISKNTIRKHRRRHSEPSNDNEEKRVHNSLSLRPQEIKQAYDQSVVIHGRPFEIGDSTSQTSLAKVLLVLNTGLVRLLNHALSSDHKSRPQVRRNLLSLSETAAMETLNTLSQLNIRLISSSRIDLVSPKPDNTDVREKRKTRPRAQSSNQIPKRPPVSPHLQKGGWVRSKSDPSIVSVVASTRAKKADPRRSPEPRPKNSTPPKPIVPPTPTKDNEQRSPPPTYTQLTSKTAPQPKPKPEHLQAYAQKSQIGEKLSTGKELVRHPSMYIVPSDFFDAIPQPSIGSYEFPSCEEDIVAPLPPPKEPLHSYSPKEESMLLPTTVGCRTGRVRPPSMMTFKTASTKIGEIPEHLWPDRELSEEQQDQTPMPYVVPDMLYPKRRGGKGLRFWRRDRLQRIGTQAITA